MPRLPPARRAPGLHAGGGAVSSPRLRLQLVVDVPTIPYGELKEQSTTLLELNTAEVGCINYLLEEVLDLMRSDSGYSMGLSNAEAFTHATAGVRLLSALYHLNDDKKEGTEDDTE